MKRILVTGACGQIGSELTLALRERYGGANVVATGHRTPPGPELRDSGPFEFINVARRETLDEVIAKHDIDTIYHMAAILSAVGEEKPHLCWDVNMNGLYNVLEAARDHDLVRVFCPSSIAAFGPETPRYDTPQETVLRPRTMYGVTKVAGELLCDYYVRRFNVDVRGVRYPGIISAETLPGGGTTDYAVAIYYEAVEHGRYTCFVREDTVLPMMYMPDALKATLDLMDADFGSLVHHSDFNLAAMSFSAGELAAEIRKHVPGFVCEYQPDFRQAIADSWPRSIDDSAARQEWGWEPAYDLAAMTTDMLDRLQKRHAAGQLYQQPCDC
ncbi:MAG: NAD-dependent epimerase/dehydratase family protein [Chloroflexi bacterium]|nr:NAD-dependent epimerase/dehydratase family protein [Chloroflexota bacterium]MBU1747026.1 NAD-dependent epimerase/dehydratase family protein [Chloroflexota bacterium]MBU1878882.1 NAD-dependent epimerase/dehydratase family protein [Chloroflexota bacterium]